MWNLCVLFFPWNHEIPLNLMLRTEKTLENSLAVQWLGFCASTGRGIGSISGHGMHMSSGTVKNKIPMGLCSFTPANKELCQNISDMPKCYINWHYPLLHCHQLLLAKAVENTSFCFSRPCPTGAWKTSFQSFVFSGSPSILLFPTSCSLFQQLRNSLHALCISMNGSTGRKSH